MIAQTLNEIVFRSYGWAFTFPCNDTQVRFLLQHSSFKYLNTVNNN